MADCEQSDSEKEKKVRSIRKRKSTKRSQLQAAWAAKFSKRIESSCNQPQSITEEPRQQQVQVAETVGPTARPTPNLHDPASRQDEEPKTKRSRNSLKIGLNPSTDYHSDKSKMEQQEGFVLLDIDILSGAISKSALCKICGIGNLTVIKNSEVSDSLEFSKVVFLTLFYQANAHMDFTAVTMHKTGEKRKVQIKLDM